MKRSASRKATYLSLLALIALSLPGNRVGMAEENDGAADTTREAVPKPADSTHFSSQSGWGKAEKGLRARLIPVSASMSENKIDPTKRRRRFKNAEDVAFVFEIQNVGSKPIKLLDTRYQSRTEDPSGFPHSDWFAQFLFSLDSIKDAGRPAVEFVDLGMTLSEAVVTTLKPGKSHRFLIRPARWITAMKFRPKPGPHRVTVSYHGLPERAADSIRQYSNSSPVLDAVVVDVSTPPVSFEVAEPTGVEAQQPPTRVWGEPTNGLRAAAAFAPNRSSQPQGTRPKLELYVQNVTQTPITICSSLTLPNLAATVTHESGKAVRVDHTRYLTRHLISRTTLRPKQIAIYEAGNIGVLAFPHQAEDFNGKTHRKFVAPLGRYVLHLSGQFGNAALRKDRDGKILAPLKGDWTGQLKSGLTPFAIAKDQTAAEAGQ